MMQQCSKCGNEYIRLGHTDNICHNCVGSVEGMCRAVMTLIIINTVIICTSCSGENNPCPMHSEHNHKAHDHDGHSHGHNHTTTTRSCGHNN